jgi:VanZ family protein
MTAFRQLRLARLWFLIGALLIAVTLYFALKPGGPPASFPYADKIYHASAFFLLSAWFAGLFERRAYLWLAVAMLAFGIGIEIAQYFMPYGRTAEVGDVIADSVGIVLGLLLAVLLRDSLFARIEKWLTPK